MPELQVTVEFEVECTKHTGIRLDAEVRDKRGVYVVYVEPCDMCMSDAVDAEVGGNE